MPCSPPPRPASRRLPHEWCGMATSMKGKTCVITGATSGIGREVAAILAAQGARIIGVGRSTARCVEACTGIVSASGNQNVTFLVADLASQAEIRGLANRIAHMTPRVDVLVNNAGTFTFKRKETVDGLETQFAVNWLSAFMLAGLLLPLLKGHGARVISLSSGSHFAGKIHWKDPGMRGGYHGLKAYDQSKLTMVLFTYELARRLGTSAGVLCHAVDPGLVKTDIGFKANGGLVRWVWRIRTRKGISPNEAARSVAFMAADTSVGGKTAGYWKECRELESSHASHDSRDADRLWALGEKLCGVSYP